MPKTGEVSLQILLALLLGFLFISLGIRGRIGSGVAALVAPEALQEGDFSGGNTEGGQSANSAPGQTSFVNQLLQFITTGGFQENTPGAGG